jgi:DNA-binding XRE family transcriptional regulator
MERNEHLREFLRSRRARLKPADVGIRPDRGARRVAGLRREELAQLAGVSVDYYVRLEQGRSVNPSEQVLDALARALRLGDAERAHLFALAKPSASRRRPAPPQRVRPGVVRLMDSLVHQPAFVLGRRMDVLASNALARALLTDFDVLPPGERNMIRWLFCDESARLLFPDWPELAAELVGVLRVDAGRHPDDPQLSKLVGDLAVQSDEFRRWWAAHPVVERSWGAKRFRHPVVGDLTIEFEALALPADPDQTLFIYTAEPGSASHDALKLLDSWAGTASAGVPSVDLVESGSRFGDRSGHASIDGRIR